MVSAIEACVHCGFCLPTCPTYLVLEEEMDSPRGRIIIMKTAMEEGMLPKEALPYIDRCLGCLACVTACPSGVHYENLLFPFRSHARNADSSSPLTIQKVKRNLTARTISDPERFRKAAKLGKLTRPAAKMLPADLQSMLELLPETIPPPIELPDISPAKGKRRARVALLSGCVQQVLAPDINQATLNVLTFNGIEVVIPKDQVCCGAVMNHTGDLKAARNYARLNLTAFQGVLSGDFDALLTNAAGCGSGIKEYPHLFVGLEEEQKALLLANKTKEISQFLVEIGLVPPPSLKKPIHVAYHDACHLLHAQKISDEPRQLIRSIEGVTLHPIAQNDICCGSAGTYNFEQPAIAKELGRLKVENILATGCDLVVAGNIGCIVQIQQTLHNEKKALPVIHTIQLLNLAYQG
jgi:glycolate oxidase iron-sulfur subunit